jgi:hypothetical protein
VGCVSIKMQHGTEESGTNEEVSVRGVEVELEES